MFFFQDNIGVLILVQKLSFFKWLITPDAEHFAPITHALIYLQYKLFGADFYPWLAVSILLHFLNVTVLYFVIKEITKSKTFALLGSLLFIINLTYIEPILWILHGLLLSMLFLGLSFYFWYHFLNSKKKKDYLLSLFFIILNSFTYGLGIGVGLIFAAVTLLFNKNIKKNLLLISAGLYGLFGVISYFIGPLVVSNFFRDITPKITSPSRDILLFPGFVIVGITRGVIGRFFLPGFEPRHFEIIPTVISFIPALLTTFFLIWYLKDKSNKSYKSHGINLINTLLIFIIYPYIWAGFVRFHFGLKQALAERYAYPSLFFLAIILTMIIKEISDKKLVKMQYIIICISLLIILQTRAFIRRAIIFEERPALTRQYFDKLKERLTKDKIIMDLPLPSYINQEYSISDLAPVITRGPMPIFIKPDKNNCKDEIKELMSGKNTREFYEEQSKDPVSGKILISCY